MKEKINKIKQGSVRDRILLYQMLFADISRSKFPINFILLCDILYNNLLQTVCDILMDKRNNKQTCFIQNINVVGRHRNVYIKSWKELSLHPFTSSPPICNHIISFENLIHQKIQNKRVDGWLKTSHSFIVHRRQKHVTFHKIKFKRLKFLLRYT